MRLSDHHGYLLYGEIGATSPVDFCTKHGLEVPTDAQIIRHTFETLTIDDARRLFEGQLRKTAEGALSLFVVETSFITREAQNAMLKMLEEPSPRTHFVLVTPHPRLLLPTLRSRLTEIGGTIEEDDETAKRFLISDAAKRLEMVTPFIEEGDRSGAEIFMKNFIKLLRENRLTEKDSSSKYIGQLDRLHGYITDTSSSVKMILEYAVYVAP